MTNNDFDTLYFDYFSNSQSYVKTILDILPEGMVSERDRNLIAVLYNYIMNTASKEKKMEISYVSTMFDDKINVVSTEEAYKQAEYIYNNFLKKIIYDSVNRTKIFNIMNECVKVFAGFYSEYEVVVWSENGITKEKNSCFR